jgi:hypothetical protein
MGAKPATSRVLIKVEIRVRFMKERSQVMEKVGSSK